MAHTGVSPHAFMEVRYSAPVPGSSVRILNREDYEPTQARIRNSRLTVRGPDGEEVFRYDFGPDHPTDPLEFRFALPPAPPPAAGPPIAAAYCAVWDALRNGAAEEDLSLPARAEIANDDPAAGAAEEDALYVNALTLRARLGDGHYRCVAARLDGATAAFEFPFEGVGNAVARRMLIALRVSAPAEAAPRATADALRGRGPLDATQRLVTFALTRPQPGQGAAAGAGVVAGARCAWLEVWQQFVETRLRPVPRASVWSFPPGMTARRATVSLTELIVPRHAPLRPGALPITALPFVWVFVRHRALVPVGEQAAAPRPMLVGPRPPGWTTDRPSAAAAPPGWVNRADTLRFVCAVPSARMCGEAAYSNLSGGAPVSVQVVDTSLVAALEVCVVLPSWEVLDVVEYDDPDGLVPLEAPGDDHAGVSVLLSLQFDEAPAKRARPE
jgi:hypothetical protein